MQPVTVETARFNSRVPDQTEVLFLTRPVLPSHLYNSFVFSLGFFLFDLFAKVAEKVVPENS